MTLLFLKLLLAHLVADFVIQPLKWIKDKEQKAFASTGLILHASVHAVLYAIAFSFNPDYWLGFAILVVSHYLIDGFKCMAGRYADNYSLPESFINRRTFFVIDQVLHLAIIAFVVSLYFTGISEWVIPQEKILALIIAVLLLTRVSSIIIKVLISRWAPLNVYDGDHSLANAGSFIGMLERLFIFVFILSGNWHGIGFLLAAKSVFRFGDLKEAHDRKLTEYILIGTLISFGLAIAVGLAYLYLI
ncbi:DUF3307 domain-containing protein [Kangiella koreensis]|uniref:DUF3307 domain-containing protein n=1 Tax=Kangiella koreensis (strain DSM 16069 / JCM 12317 / KCTC 12182 / SW-125) TaxID=523791 RepID=C7R5M9_KANKD|nr:DUF3307 domain-containing protein [Kangiella koreensis]ACV27203.1 conserved hypothetical protein [Kangiella koreensis DSM 16069]